MRRPFGIVTKRIEWFSVGGESGKKALVKYVKDQKAPARMPRSKCRACKRPLTWGSGTYDFDHKDNNSANNSQSNCYLVCKICHGKATKVRVVREYDPWFGSVVGYRTQKLKVGYKKTTKKPARKVAGRRATSRTAKKPVRRTVKKPTKKPARTKR
jgi:hypothetical protein